PPSWQIIHLTGKTRPHELSDRAGAIFPNYHPYQFLTTEMKDAYALAEVIIARAGFATITEAASLAKPLVLVPMSGTHQEDNARLLSENNAAVVLDERTDDGLKLAQVVKELMELPEKRQNLGARLKAVLPPASPERIVAIIEELTKR
ncbi:MAG: glycosyltransferase, partial [Candidatus Komeilibacteria bacterium]|nr:glycosyltransferase [Candidatus Komeilibacteria bacterium]